MVLWLGCDGHQESRVILVPHTQVDTHGIPLAVHWYLGGICCSAFVALSSNWLNGNLLPSFESCMTNHARFGLICTLHSMIWKIRFELQMVWKKRRYWLSLSWAARWTTLCGTVYWFTLLCRQTSCLMLLCSGAFIRSSSIFWQSVPKCLMLSN